MEQDNQTITKEEVEASSILELVKLMASVDTNSPEAELNAITISDGNGGRIFF